MDAQGARRRRVPIMRHLSSSGSGPQVQVQYKRRLAIDAAKKIIIVITSSSEWRCKRKNGRESSRKKGWMNQQKKDQEHRGEVKSDRVRLAHGGRPSVRQGF